jgi:isoleucyl-tRNA synthetase
MLPDLFLVSGLSFGATSGDYTAVAEDESGFKVSVDKADGAKCERCWRFSGSVGTLAAHPTICDRCAKVVEGGGPPPL